MNKLSVSINGSIEITPSPADGDVVSSIRQEEPLGFICSSHTCLEAAVRFAAELGYNATVVRDATADYSEREMHAALEVNLPSYASAIVTTNEAIAAITDSA